LNALVLLAIAIHASQWLTLLTNLAYLRRWRPREHKPSGAQGGRLSVLIPAYNEAHNLRRLLPSLARQTHPDLEVIIVDDGSTDATWDVLEASQDPRLRALRGQGPPPGWLGKVHALHQATREATGHRYLFLDADTELLRPDALERIESVFEQTPHGLLTGIPKLAGGGMLLVSMVSAAILNGLPWVVAGWTRLRSLGALNGQCWMIGSEDYHRFEPHEANRTEILEDVRIGRFLMERGMTPILTDLRGDLAVHMYTSFGDAWRGFRKNAYLIMGGNPLGFALMWAVYGFSFTVAPFLFLPLLASLYLLKTVTDRWMGIPIWVTAMTPVAYILATLLQLDSALSHLLGRVTWKGRRVG
jgi:glycosyltransferase involved in cell wall biosynthesis